MALLARGKSKHGHTVSQVICDQCGIEGLGRQIHPTLYKVNRAMYYCETHMIVNGLRHVTPDFIRALNATKTQADTKA